MRTQVFRRIPNRRLAAFVLLAFVLRALIPLGFMPSGDGLFSFELCPGSFPMQQLAGGEDHSQHHHHAGDEGEGNPDNARTGFEHCPFGSAPFAGPLPHVGGSDAPEPSTHALFALPAGITGERLIRYQQARGPPALS